MTKGIILGFSAAIVVVLLLLAGSSLGAYVRAQVEEREAGAIACHDSVSCSHSDWVMQVTNTGKGKAISAVAKKGGSSNSAISGGARGQARGVYGVSKLGEGVYGKNSTSGNFGYLGGSDYGVCGTHNSGNYGFFGTPNEGVYGQSGSGDGVVGYSYSGKGLYGYSYNGIGVYATSGSNSLIEAWDIEPTQNLRFRVDNDGNVYADKGIQLKEASVPSQPPSGQCVIWLDSSSGDLRIKFDDNTIKILATDD